MAREFLRLTPESVWGTFDAMGTAILVDLTENNAFDMRITPIMWKVRSTAGFARPWATGSSKREIKGGLKMLVPAADGVALAAWVDNGGAAAPGSMTIDHVIMREDASSTLLYARYLGARVLQAAFTGSAADQLLKLNLSLQAKTTAVITVTDFAEPALADYNTSAYYVFEHSSGAATIAGSVRTIDNFNCTIKNNWDPQFFNSTNIASMRYCGRDVTMSSKLPYDVTTFRDDWEATTAVGIDVVLTNGANSLTFDGKAANYLTAVKDDLSLDKLYLQEISLESYVDRSASTDFELAAT